MPLTRTQYSRLAVSCFLQAAAQFMRGQAPPHIADTSRRTEDSLRAFLAPFEHLLKRMPLNEDPNFDEAEVEQMWESFVWFWKLMDERQGNS